METESRDCVVFNREDRSAESSCGYERGRAVFCEAQSTFSSYVFSPYPSPHRGVAGPKKGGGGGYDLKIEK